MAEVGQKMEKNHRKMEVEKLRKKRPKITQKIATNVHLFFFKQ